MTTRGLRNLGRHLPPLNLSPEMGAEYPILDCWSPPPYQAGSPPGQPTHPGLPPCPTVIQHCPGLRYPGHVQHPRKWTSENEPVLLKTVPRDPPSLICTHDFESFLGERTPGAVKVRSESHHLGRLRASNGPSSHHLHPLCAPTLSFLNLGMNVILFFLPVLGPTYLTSYSLRQMFNCYD